MYYIGIDGGGTKTAFGLFDEDGHIIDELEQSTCHFLQVGFEGCAKCLYEGIESLILSHRLSKEDVYIGIGIAGYGNDENIRRQLEKHIAAVLPNYHYALTNDMHVAMIGALNGSDGIAVVAGTGAIAMAQVHQQIIRSGGWGYQLGDEGSAYWIGKELLKYFTYQADGRYPKDDIYTQIMEHFQMNNPYQIISIMNQFENQRTEVAALAKVCAQLADHHSVCQTILKSAGKHVSDLVISLQNHFTNKPLVTYYGGVFQNPIFKKSFMQSLNDCIVIEPRHNAVVGAYYFAKQNINQR